MLQDFVKVLELFFYVAFENKLVDLIIFYPANFGLLWNVQLMIFVRILKTIIKLYFPFSSFTLGHARKGRAVHYIFSFPKEGK